MQKTTASISSFPKIFNIGNSYIPNLFVGEVEVTEKIDGSQFGFGITKDGEIVCRSKGVQLYSADQNGMFKQAWEQVERMTPKLEEWHRTNEKVKAFGAYFYGEYLMKEKHNSLTYQRLPKNHIILFGARIGDSFVNEYDILKGIAEDFDLEVVPLIYKGEFKSDVDGVKQFDEMLKTKSVLGGVEVEGVVVKNYKQPCMIGNLVIPSFGKYVREDFRELNHKNWSKGKSTNRLQEFFESFKTKARWNKAIQYLRETGKLTDSPKDIGAIMSRVKQDITEEEVDNIKTWLYNHFKNDIGRIAIAGLPQWYKHELLKKGFNV